MTVTDPDGAVDPLCLGICRGATYGLFGSPEPIVAPARRLGAGLVRITLYWSQVEPEPGRYDWTVLDAFLEQLTGEVRAWITVAGSSPWGSRISTRFLPPSPAVDRRAYARFVRQLVCRAAGQVAYWQCEIEPSVPLMWSGTPLQYVDQLRDFADAVRGADGDAIVVLGGAVPQAMLADPDGGDPTSATMRSIIAMAADLYDAFDLHAYGDPNAIPDLVAAARSMMAESGSVKPVFAGEYAGPMPTAFRQNLPALARVLASYRSTFADTLVSDGGLGSEPDDPAMLVLNRDQQQLPDTLRMFLHGCPPELTVDRDRIVSSELIIRTALLAAADVRVAAPFQLAPERPDQSPFTARALMFGAFALHDYPEGNRDPAGWVGHPRLAADTFARLAGLLEGADSARLIDGGDPELFVVEVAHRGVNLPNYLAWRPGDGSADLDLPIPSTAAVDVIDAFGRTRTTDRQLQRISLSVDNIPVLISAVEHRSEP